MFPAASGDVEISDQNCYKWIKEPDFRSCRRRPSRLCALAHKQNAVSCSGAWLPLVGSSRHGGPTTTIPAHIRARTGSPGQSLRPAGRSGIRKQDSTYEPGRVGGRTVANLCWNNVAERARDRAEQEGQEVSPSAATAPTPTLGFVHTCIYAKQHGEPALRQLSPVAWDPEAVPVIMSGYPIRTRRHVNRERSVYYRGRVIDGGSEKHRRRTDEHSAAPPGMRCCRHYKCGAEYGSGKESFQR